MSISVETITERTISFRLGSVVFCEETGWARFSLLSSTARVEDIREFAEALNNVASMMDDCGAERGQERRERGKA
jgi:hypothetical protein